MKGSARQGWTRRVGVELLGAMLFVAAGCSNSGPSGSTFREGGKGAPTSAPEQEPPIILLELDSGAPIVTCQPGFEKRGTECVDVDECATNRGGCDPLTKSSRAAGC